MLFYAGATGWDYALRCLLVLLCTPLLPLLLSAVLCMLLMRFTVLWRHRDTVLTMASLALLLGYFVGQAMLSNRIPKDFDASFLTAYLLGRRSMVDALTAWYPPARWAADALTLGGDAVWRSLGLLVGVSLLGLAVTLGMAQRAYYASALAMGEQAKARTRVRRRSLRVGGAQSPALAIYLREWRMVLRTPTYAINSLSSIFMTPLIVSMPTMFSSGQWDRAQLLGFLHSQVPVPLLILITTGIIGFFSAINPAAGTVISREGTNFWLAQTVPIPGRTQVLIKYGFGASISIPAVALAALCLPLSLGIAWPVAAGVFALCALMCLHINAVAVLIDLARPNFRWENPAQIIKQSLNAMLSMLYGLVLMLVLAALLWGGYALGLSWGAMAWGVGGVLAALGAASTALLLRKSEALFAKLCR
jgi:ABC-2 type transport system permease protein